MSDHKLQFIFIWRLNDWGLFNRRHEALARELAKRDNVESVLHIEHISFRGLVSLLLHWLKEKDRSLRKAYAVQIKKGFSLAPVGEPAAAKLAVYSVVLFYSGENGILKRINEIAKRLQYGMLNNRISRSKSRNILVAYPPSGPLPEAIRSIRHDVLIADLVDDNICRAADNVEKKNLNIENMRDILPNCKWIFSTSPVFNDEYNSYAGQPIDHIPNGVDIDNFTELKGIEFPRRVRRKIGYVGIISKEINLELLEFVVSHNPESDFFLIGKVTDELAEVMSNLASKLKNLFCLGPQNHDEVSGFMKNCDILINVKNDDRTTAGADSIKIYEYLATGKPIVATPMPPADRFADLIYVTADKKQFADYIKKALNEDDNELSEKRIKVAMENSWAKRVDVILDKVAQFV